MELTTGELSKLDQAKSLFKTDRLTREQAELILGRKLSNAEWGKFSRSNPEIESKKELRKNNKDKPEPNETLKIKSLFKLYKDEFTITKSRTYQNAMYNTESSIWKIRGNITLFNVNRAIIQLIDKMMGQTPENSRIMIMIHADKLGDQATQSQLLSKSKAED